MRQQLPAIVSSSAERVKTFLSINEEYTYREIFTFSIHTMGGQVQRITWKPTAQGVTEQVLISFPDKSRVLISRFMFKVKQETNISVAIY
jgi:hypothetical protein